MCTHIEAYTLPVEHLRIHWRICGSVAADLFMIDLFGGCAFSLSPCSHMN